MIRFLSPRTPDLVLPAVPATFVAGICDLSDEVAISRMRFLGVPFGVQEVGEVADVPPPDPIAGQPELHISRENAATNSIVVLQSDGSLAFREVIGGPGVDVDVDERGNIVISLSGV